MKQFKIIIKVALLNKLHNYKTYCKVENVRKKWNYEKVAIIREEDTTVRYKVTIKIVTLSHNYEKKKLNYEK